MTLNARFHPVSLAPSAPSQTGFGFDSIMAEADFGAFRRWYDAFSYIAPGRAGVADVLSQPVAEQSDGSGIDWAA